MGTPSISLRPAGQTGWIISGTEDLTWFIGPALVSYAALALMEPPLEVSFAGSAS